MQIQLPDGSIKSYDRPVTPAQVAADIGAGLAKAAIGARINGELADLNRPIEAGTDQTVELKLITRPRTDKTGRTRGDHDPDALYLLRHSTAHIMAEAICDLWPETKLAYGPPLENGFYYDLYLETPISSEDFARIEARMKEIIAEARPFTRYDLPPDQGLEKLEAEGNKYKIDNAQRAIEAGSATLSWYITGLPEKGHWEDLCMGPHVPDTGVVGAFKLMNIAASHWRGDVESDRFQRLYGTAFFTEADLEDHLEKLEQARQRDHRVIGQRLGLFTIDEQVGQGLILWKPRGGAVRSVLEKFLQEQLFKLNYEMVYTPHIGKVDLYKTSGHYPYYSDSQFPPIQMRDGDEQYLLRPMNCPHHIKIYSSEPRSYRDLPVRLAEFGTVYRFEQSGELTGMTRVRGFTQDDAHIFCTPDQVKNEFRQTVDLVRFVFNTFGFEDVSIRLSLREPGSKKYVGDPANWDRAELELREVLESMEIHFTEGLGEAAFYGPKTDFMVRDVIGRSWQLGTVQLDYNLPERFALEYIGPDSKPHRPVMIHRAPFGSMERFMAILIEHYAGAFPLWLAPEQFRILPISEKAHEYATRVLDELRKRDWRATLDAGNDRISAKVKVAQDDKVPYMLVVGPRDEQAGQVSIRDRYRGDLGALPLEAFIQQADTEILTRGKNTVLEGIGSKA
ncbi:MAG: threonine--tRNA ligase [Phycisphaeraceae bacterium]|nr:threonine--tRNA ligase [Phycisphaeraceae bacterium]